MRLLTSISITAILFLALMCASSCRGKDVNQEELHRSPAQRGEIPEKIELKNPHELHQPKRDEYQSEYINPKKKTSSLVWAGSIEQALQMTKNESSKRKTIVYFATTGPCEDCRYIEEKVFADPQVLKYSERWVFVRVNADTSPDLAKYHQIDSVPAFKFMDRFGHGYKTYIGKVTPEQFAEMLQTWY